MSFSPLVELLRAAGAYDVIILDWQPGSLILSLWPYEADTEENRTPGQARIHPYYDVSQQAYRAAARICAQCETDLPGLKMADEIRVKPIFARLRRFRTGRNTLHYDGPRGSRFHVQIMTCNVRLPATDRMETKEIPSSCGNCRLCMDNCPTGAILEDGFRRERCIRYWMLSGKTVPEELRGAMGDRLIGCDACQSCCPMNKKADTRSDTRVPLLEILNGSDEAELKQRIGTNLAIRNRLLAQACLIAGSNGDAACHEVLKKLAESPSEAVRTHAAWALSRYADVQPAQAANEERCCSLREDSSDKMDRHMP